MTINSFNNNNNLLYNMLYMFMKKNPVFPKEKVEWEELYYFTLYKSL